jgi:hypothetical protein
MYIDARWSILVSVVLVACSTTTVVDNPVPGTGPSAGANYLHITAVAPGYAGRVASDDRWLIYLEGFIDSGATARLERMLDGEQIRSAVVYFDSPGGHVVEAMALGRLLRERRYVTSVGARAADAALPRPGRCYSACPIAYAGGVHRSLATGSVLGVHRARNSVPVPDEAAFQGLVTRQVKDYLAAMGVSPEFVTLMSGVPNDTIRDLTADEDVRLGLVNAAP